MKRREFLRGIGGATLSMPAMASLGNSASAGPRSSAGSSPATTPAGAPLRTVFVYFPNGAHQEHWFGQSDPSGLRLGQTLQPMRHLQDSIQMIGGLDHENAEAGPDGPGDHARANATFLTGVRAKKTSGADIRLGRSIDQELADAVGDQTRFKSLELSCDAVRKSGECDSGYSCAYQYNLAWRSETQPMAPETNPRALYERLFGIETPVTADESFRLAKQDRKNLLDFVLADAKDVRRRLGGSDSRKLDEYLSSVRDIEISLAKAEQFPKPERPDMPIPAGVPDLYDRHIDLMFDLLAIALQSDATRVATMMLAADGSNRSFPQIGLPEGHHYLTHQSAEEMREKVALIDRFYVQRFTRFLDKLAATTDSDGSSVLHNSIIVYGGGIGDGNRHNHDNLPILVAGHGGGKLKPGRFVDAGSQPMSNLYVGLADKVGVSGIESFGDSDDVFDDV